MKNEHLKALLARAKVQADNGEWVAAMESCWAALAEDRNCSEAMYRLGELYADARCPLADVEKAVYWFDASYRCSEVYKNPETDKDGWDRMTELFKRECCPDLDYDRMEQRFFRAIELMRNISPFNEVVCNVRELFEKMTYGDIWLDDPDLGVYIVDLSLFENFTRPLPKYHHTANNYFRDDDDFPWTASLKCEWPGNSAPVPGETREVIERSFWRKADEKLRPGIIRVVVYEKWEPRIVECWNETEEQLDKYVIRHTVQVMRVRHLEDYIVRPANGRLPPLKQKMYLPNLDASVRLRGHSVYNGLSWLDWGADLREYADEGGYPHENHWMENGTIYTYVDDDSIEYQLATTGVSDDWMCFGSRAL